MSTSKLKYQNVKSSSPSLLLFLQYRTNSIYESWRDLDPDQCYIFSPGAIAVPAGGGGTFFGGWVIKRKNLKLKGIVRLCAIFAAASFFLCFGYLIQCKSPEFAGLNTAYNGQ